MNIQKNSPSNIQTGWRQKFFHKIEHDSLLDELIKIFTKHGNNWSMDRLSFDELSVVNNLNEHRAFQTVCYEVLETRGAMISFKQEVVAKLLKHNRRWSLKNTIKQMIHFTSINQIKKGK